MKKSFILLVICALFVVIGHVSAQSKAVPAKKTRVELYYFHPTERCPIDQSIEETTRKLMQQEFAKQMKDGEIKFQVINTEDKTQALTVSRFEINAQALYLVTHKDGKEIKNDLTEFAFSTAQNNPGKFKTSLKQDILTALK